MRPVAYVCLKDAAARARVIRVLERNNYAAIVQPTGFHLIRAMADVIEGRESRGPALIVVDAWAPGCAGKTIEAGLRDLGVRIPIELVETSADVDAFVARWRQRPQGQAQSAARVMARG